VGIGIAPGKRWAGHKNRSGNGGGKRKGGSMAKKKKKKQTLILSSKANAGRNVTIKTLLTAPRQTSAWVRWTSARTAACRRPSAHRGVKTSCTRDARQHGSLRGQKGGDKNISVWISFRATSITTTVRSVRITLAALRPGAPLGARGVKRRHITRARAQST